MGPVGVAVIDEGVQANMLLQEVMGGRPGGLVLQGQMHALMTAILLRMSWLDALDVDAQAEPPHRACVEAAQVIAA
jgi:hypothetical protein